ncbi:hypothetical protein BsWGS_12125 [Bradybaena similaris]
MAPKNIKLIYFDSRGRAEGTRLVLAAAGQKYEDLRLSHEQWEIEKPNTPFQQAPVLEVDGKRYGQSIAIATYLAREFGLYGKSNLDGLQIDQVIQLAADFFNALVQSFREKDEAKKEELQKKFKEVEVPKYLGFLEKLLTESGTGYFVGNSLTLADIWVYDLLYSFVSHKALTTDGYPHIQELNKNVESNENIKVYLATRKQTPF